MFFLALCLCAIDDPAPATGKAKPGRVFEVLNEVEGRTVILSLAPEGSTVKKGQVIVELDSAGFHNDLIDQQIAVKQAEVDVLAAKSAREIAESEAVEQAMVVAREAEQLTTRVKLAETGVAVATAQLDEARKTKMATRIGPAEAAKAKADGHLKDQRLLLKTLRDVSGPKRIQEAENKQLVARSEESVKVATLAAEQSVENKLRKQIDRCKILSPTAGMVLYANPDDGRPDPPPIEEGAIVRERQPLVRIVPN